METQGSVVFISKTKSLNIFIPKSIIVFVIGEIIMGVVPSAIVALFVKRR